MTALVCDLVLHNAVTLTMDECRPRAGAVAVHHGRVVAVGDDLAAMPAARHTVDLAGACLIPGFHDAHNHMAWFGETLQNVPLGDAAVHSLDELYAAMSQRAEQEPDATWVIGDGYDDNKIGGHPSRDGLDQATGRRLAMATHTSGHMCVVSSAVLERIGLAERGCDVTGGTVVVDAAGRPTGLLQERAQELVTGLLRPVPLDRLADSIGRAGAHYAAEGITSVVEAGVGGGWLGRSPAEVAAYQKVRDADRLPVRVELMPVADVLHDLDVNTTSSFGLDLGLRTGLGDGRLCMGPVKLFCDGSLIGHTAAMTEDYADQPGNRGYLQRDPEELVEIVVRAHLSGWRVAAHAIGDAAIDVVLDAVDRAQRQHPRPGVRHRIEHFGVSRPDQLTRAASLGVVPVPQGRFVGEIGDGMATALGPRAACAYRLRSLLDAGLPLPGSSDRPVVDGRPMLGVHDMVNRVTASGAPYAADEAITPYEALRAYTLGSAYASCQETDRGSIEPGKRADFAILAQDPTSSDPYRLGEIAVLGTLLGGTASFDSGIGLPG